MEKIVIDEALKKEFEDFVRKHFTIDCYTFAASRKYSKKEHDVYESNATTVGFQVFSRMKKYNETTSQTLNVAMGHIDLLLKLVKTETKIKAEALLLFENNIKLIKEGLL